MNYNCKALTFSDFSNRNLTINSFKALKLREKTILFHLSQTKICDAHLLQK